MTISILSFKNYSASGLFWALVSQFSGIVGRINIPSAGVGTCFHLFQEDVISDGNMVALTFEGF